MNLISLSLGREVVLELETSTPDYMDKWAENMDWNNYMDKWDLSEQSRI